MCERLTLTDHTSLRKVILARTDRCVQVKESLVMPRDGDKLDSLLKQAFDEGVSRPIERSSLNALTDMGLSIDQIALYFSADPVEVQAILKSCR
jgi:hypothetical protein